MTTRPVPASSPRNRAGGFTLVELLVVIGIIAVLMGILMPALNRARESSQRIKCLSNVRSLGTAFMMYINENKGKFPPYTASRSFPKELDWIYWQTLPRPGRRIDESVVVRYLGTPVNKEVLRCPSDAAEEHQLNGNPANVGPFLYSYVVNTNVLKPFPTPPAKPVSLSITQVKNASDKIFIGEEDENTIDDGHWVATGNPPQNKLAIRHDRTRIQPDDATNWPRNLERRGNVVFLDFHADYVSRAYTHDNKRLDPLLPN